MKKTAFSFLEIIVSIVIMWILLSVSSVAIKKWLITSKDLDRNTSLTLISNWLKQYFYNNDFYPMPDNSLTITASGNQNIVWYQWYFGEQVAEIIWISPPKDPTDETYYTYYINGSHNIFQALWYLEKTQVAFVDTLYADDVDYNNRYIVTKWDKAGILINQSDNKPLQEVFSGKYDLITGSQDLLVYFTDDIFYNLSGYRILTVKTIYDKNLSKYDTWLVAYRDMSTVINSGTSLVLKDLSIYWNNWICYNSWDIVNCWEYNNWPQIIDSPTDKAMKFDWTDDRIKIPKTDSLNITWNKITIFTRFNPKVALTGNMEIIGRHTWAADCQGSMVVYTGWVLMSYIKVGSTNYWLAWTSANLVKYGQYNYLSLVYDSTKFLLYNNNEKIITNWVSWNIPTFGGSSYAIWKYSYTTPLDFFNWVIDEIRIYNRDLSEYEIEVLKDSFNN